MAADYFPIDVSTASREAVVHTAVAAARKAIGCGKEMRKTEFALNTPRLRTRFGKIAGLDDREFGGVHVTSESRDDDIGVQSLDVFLELGVPGEGAADIQIARKPGHQLAVLRTADLLRLQPSGLRGLYLLGRKSNVQRAFE